MSTIVVEIYISGDIGTYTQNLTEKPTEATNIIFIDLKGSIKPYGQPVDVQLCLLSHAKYTLSIYSYKNTQQNVCKQLYFKMKSVAATYKRSHMFWTYIGYYLSAHSHI